MSDGTVSEVEKALRTLVASATHDLWERVARLERTLEKHEERSRVHANRLTELLLERDERAARKVDVGGTVHIEVCNDGQAVLSPLAMDDFEQVIRRYEGVPEFSFVVNHLKEQVRAQKEAALEGAAS